MAHTCSMLSAAWYLQRHLYDTLPAIRFQLLQQVPCSTLSAYTLSASSLLQHDSSARLAATPYLRTHFLHTVQYGSLQYSPCSMITAPAFTHLCSQCAAEYIYQAQSLIVFCHCFIRSICHARLAPCVLRMHDLCALRQPSDRRLLSQ